MCHYTPFQDKSRRFSCLIKLKWARVWAIPSIPTTKMLTWTNCLSQPLLSSTNRSWDFTDISKKVSLSQNWRTIESGNWPSTISSRTDQFLWLNQKWLIVEPCRELSLIDKWSWSRTDLICHLNQVTSELASILDSAADPSVFTMLMSTPDNSSRTLDLHRLMLNLAQRMLSCNHASQFHQRRTQSSSNSWRRNSEEEESHPRNNSWTTIERCLDSTLKAAISNSSGITSWLTTPSKLEKFISPMMVEIHSPCTWDVKDCQRPSTWINQDNNSLEIGIWLAMKSKWENNWLLMEEYSRSEESINSLKITIWLSMEEASQLAASRNQTQDQQ